MSDNSNDLLDFATAARLTGCDKTTVRDLAEEGFLGEITHRHPGLRIHRDALERLLALRGEKE